MPNDAWGLTFAGGGGKGSYQIGVWSALRELGYEEKIIGVSGASVGALNALLFASQQLEAAEDIWRSIRPIQFLNPTDNFSFLNDADGIIAGLFRQARTHGICSRDGLRSILQNDVDLTQIAAAPMELYVCVTCCNGTPSPDAATPEKENGGRSFSLEHLSENLISYVGRQFLDASCPPSRRSAVYVRLNDADAPTITNTLLASSAMPYVYEPVMIGDSLYRDGGLTDNVPLRPLTEHGIKNLIIVKLEPDDQIDRRLCAQCRHVIEITPSREIGDLFDGTLDFGQKNVSFRMELGYDDALRALKAFEQEQHQISQ